MRLCFISDIHANLPALEAVLKDTEKNRPDCIYCLGDLVNFAGWDNEVVDLIRKRNIPVIMGNHDEGIGNNKSQFSFSFNNEQQEEFGFMSINRVNKTITSANRSYLKTLPFMLQFEFRLSFHPVRIVLIHGSTSSVDEYVTEHAKDDYLLDMMETVNADILLMGHTHVPYHRSIFCKKGDEPLYRHAINVGSVGKPKHGDKKACYALLEMDENTSLADPSTVSLSFHYVPYNIWAVIKRIEQCGLSNAYTNFLLNGQ